jgi:hypothetical protein
MFRTSIVVSVITAFSSVAAFAEDARQLTCTGTMIEPSAMSQSPETVVMTLGKGVVNARRVSDNKIQLKFRTKEFEGEYFHYTGDLFFIYKTGHLMRLMCQKHEGARGEWFRPRVALIAAPLLHIPRSSRSRHQPFDGNTMRTFMSLRHRAH